MLLSASEAARRVGRHPVTVKRWAAEGLFPPPTRINRRLYWHAADVDKFVERTRNTVKAEFAR